MIISEMIEKAVAKANKHYRKHGRDEKFIELEDEIIATNDVNIIYGFAKDVKGADKSKMTLAITATNDARCIYLCALSASDYRPDRFDFEILTDGIIATKDIERIYYFARYVEGANIAKLTDAIIESNDVFYIGEFACNVEGADIKKLEDATIKINNAEYIYYFARDVKGADIARLTEAIIKTRYAHYIYSFAYDVEGADIGKLTDAIIATKSAEYIYKFALRVKGADRRKLGRAIRLTCDYNWISEYAENIGDKYIWPSAEEQIASFQSDNKPENN